MGLEIVEGEGAVLGVNVGYPIVTSNQWGLCGIVILCPEGWQLLWDFFLLL